MEIFLLAIFIIWSLSAGIKQVLLLKSDHCLYIKQVQIVIYNQDLCGALGHLQDWTPSFSKKLILGMKYDMAFVLSIFFLVFKPCSSDSWAGLTKLSSSGRTVSGIVACGLHCHSDRDCSAFSFVQDGKTCQMAKLVTHWNEFKRPTTERLLYI